LPDDRVDVWVQPIDLLKMRLLMFAGRNGSLADRGSLFFGGL